MAQKILWVNRNMVLTLIFGKNYAYLANLIFENLSFHCLFSLLQGDQDHFLAKEMLISPSILKLLKNP